MFGIDYLKQRGWNFDFIVLIIVVIKRLKSFILYLIIPAILLCSVVSKISQNFKYLPGIMLQAASTFPMQPPNFEAQKNLGREDACLR